MGRKTSEADLLRFVTKCYLPFFVFRENLALTRTGKILKDEETVGSYNIEEKGFVVCMVNKVCSLTPDKVGIFSG